MAKPSILVVEDEKDLAKILTYNLGKEGYAVTAVHDGEAALLAFKKKKPALIVLDVMLPKMNGFEICREIRKESHVPIIMLTAKAEEVDRVLGLELGADDYVTKPFSVRELMARVKTILRRASSSSSAQTGSVQLGQIHVDLDRYTVSLKGKPVRLSSKEFEFLKCLLQSKGKVLTRDELLSRVWGYDQSLQIDTRTVDQHIARLREKLGSEAARLVTVKNVGYRLDLE